MQLQGLKKKQTAVNKQEPPVTFLIPPSKLSDGSICAWYLSDTTQEREKILESQGFSAKASASAPEPNQIEALKLSIYIKMYGLLGVAMLRPEEFDQSLLFELDSFAWY